MRYFRSYFLALFPALILSACATDYPNPFPRGYSSYEEPYKSAPGPKAHDVGYDFSIDKNETTLEDMRYAAGDLVEKLDDKLSFTTDKIYLEIPGKTAFYTSFDYVLREEFTKRGYLLSNTPDDAVKVIFWAQDLNEPVIPEYEIKKDAGQLKIYRKENEDYRDLHLMLATKIVNDVAYDYVDGIYEVPAYDFVTSKYIQISDEKLYPCQKPCCDGNKTDKEMCHEPCSAGSKEVCVKP